MVLPTVLDGFGTPLFLPVITHDARDLVVLDKYPSPPKTARVIGSTAISPKYGTVRLANLFQGWTDKPFQLPDRHSLMKTIELALVEARGVVCASTSDAHKM